MSRRIVALLCPGRRLPWSPSFHPHRLPWDWKAEVLAESWQCLHQSLQNCPLDDGTVYPLKDRDTIHAPCELVVAILTGLAILARLFLGSMVAALRETKGNVYLSGFRSILQVPKHSIL